MTVTALIHQLENDLKRFPVPKCIKGEDQNREYNIRQQKIRALAHRYMAIKAIKENRNAG
jgi:hypothetical protein